MVIRTKPSRFLPMAIFIKMIFSALLVAIVMVFKQSGFSATSFLLSIEILAEGAILLAILQLEQKKGKALQLDDDGVWSVVWTKPSRSDFFPKLKKSLLKWCDVEDISVRANLISIKGPMHRVVLNIYLFNDSDEVINFIKKATKRL